MNNIYVNGYNCAIDDKGKEVVINCLLTLPKIQPDDTLKAETETVTTLIMTREMAEMLKISLDDVLKK